MTKRNRVSMTTVDLYPPYPETLPIVFYAKTDKTFAETPVVLRAKVFREKQLIGDFATVMGSNVGKSPRLPVPTFPLDAFADMDTIPESMLIHAQAELLLSPPGTKEELIDPLTFSVEDLMNKTVMLSNPIRINFHNEAPEPLPEP